MSKVDLSCIPKGSDILLRTDNDNHPNIKSYCCNKIIVSGQQLISSIMRKEDQSRFHNQEFYTHTGTLAGYDFAHGGICMFDLWPIECEKTCLQGKQGCLFYQKVSTQHGIAIIPIFGGESLRRKKMSIVSNDHTKQKIMYSKTEFYRGMYCCFSGNAHPSNFWSFFNKEEINASVCSAYCITRYAYALAETAKKMITLLVKSLKHEIDTKYLIKLFHPNLPSNLSVHHIIFYFATIAYPQIKSFLALIARRSAVLCPLEYLIIASHYPALFKIQEWEYNDQTN